MGRTFRVRHGSGYVEIPELTEDQAKEYVHLGTSESSNEDHCMYLALKNGYMLLDRVVGYLKVPPTKYEVAMAFYGQPTPREWSPRKKKKD